MSRYHPLNFEQLRDVAELRSDGVLVWLSQRDRLRLSVCARCVTCADRELGGVEESAGPVDRRRAKLIAITKSGTRALRAVEQRHSVWANQLASRLERAGLQATLQGLIELREALKHDAVMR